MGSLRNGEHGMSELESGRALNDLTPYHEVAAMLVLAGIVKEVPSVQQVVDIERRALRKLRARPEIRRLYRDCFNQTPAMA